MILISSPEKIQGEIDMVCRFFEEGLEYFHLRKPEWKEKELENYLQSVPDEYRNRIVLHSYYNLAKRYNLKGIHITKKTKNQGFEEHFKNFHISISTHSMDEIMGLKKKYNYLFISPVFNSISKNGYQSQFNPSILSGFLRENPITTPVIALGGIYADNIHQLKDTGISGFAVLGAIWEEFSKHQSTENTMQIFRVLMTHTNHNEYE